MEQPTKAKRNRERSRRYRTTHPEQVREYNREWRKAHPNYNREWYKAHPEQVREQRKKWRKTNREKEKKRRKEWRIAHPEIAQECKRKYRLRIRIAVLTHYGKGKLACAHCGFSDMRALSIDHISGNGKEHKRQIRQNITAWLWRENFPSGFQTLCMNCQFIKRHENKEHAGQKRTPQEVRGEGIN